MRYSLLLTGWCRNTQLRKFLNDFGRHFLMEAAVLVNIGVSIQHLHNTTNITTSYVFLTLDDLGLKTVREVNTAITVY